MTNSMSKKGVFSLLLCYLPVLCVQVFSSLVTSASLGNWYNTIEKSAANPPGWVFGPVWTLLYILMALSLWLVWMSSEKNSKKVFPTIVFLLQLCLNALWTPLFFYFKLPAWALVDLGALVILLVLNIVLFWRFSRLSAFFLFLYFLWAAFALYLNASIVWMN